MEKNSRFVVSVMLGIGLAVAAGCATVPAGEPGVAPGGEAAKIGREVPRELAALPETAPDASDLAAVDAGAEDIRRYRIGPGDVLHIQVRGEADLSGDFKVSPDGLILYAYLGRVPVAGYSVAAMESNLTAMLGRDYLVDPKVYVQVKSSVLRRVIIFGEVKSPGVYEMQVGERFSLLQAIAKAGGPTELAATDRVRIVRRSETGKDRAIRVNVTNLLRGDPGASDVELRSNDVIIIPQTVF